MVQKNSLHLKYWSLHILMKNVISKEFALKLLDLQNCFLMENDPIFLFNRIILAESWTNKWSHLKQFYQREKMLYPHQFIMSVAAAEKDIMACGFPPPSLPASTNWFVNDKIWVLIMKCYIGLAIEHLLWWGALSTGQWWAGHNTSPHLFIMINTPWPGSCCWARVLTSHAIIAWKHISCQCYVVMSCIGWCFVGWGGEASLAGEEPCV